MKLIKFILCLVGFIVLSFCVAAFIASKMNDVSFISQLQEWLNHIFYNVK